MARRQRQACLMAPSRPAGRPGGFTYLGLLFALAIASVALAGTGVLWHFEGRREKEKELLFAGEAYRRALASYYDLSPGGEKQYPRQLEELLLDKRFPVPVRHLRQLYRDPMTRDGKWQLLILQERIYGVASSSREVPIKHAGFGAGQEAFEKAGSYAEWRFESGMGK